MKAPNTKRKPLQKGRRLARKGVNELGDRLERLPRDHHEAVPAVALRAQHRGPDPVTIRVMLEHVAHEHALDRGRLLEETGKQAGEFSIEVLAEACLEGLGGLRRVRWRAAASGGRLMSAWL